MRFLWNRVCVCLYMAIGRESYLSYCLLISFFMIHMFFKMPIQVFEGKFEMMRLHILFVICFLCIFDLLHIYYKLVNTLNFRSLNIVNWEIFLQKTILKFVVFQSSNGIYKLYCMKFRWIEKVLFNLFPFNVEYIVVVSLPIAKCLGKILDALLYLHFLFYPKSRRFECIILHLFPMFFCKTIFTKTRS